MQVRPGQKVKVMSLSPVCAWFPHRKIIINQVFEMQPTKIYNAVDKSVNDSIYCAITGSDKNKLNHKVQLYFYKDYQYQIID